MQGSNARHAGALVVAALLGVISPAWAQVDYRNLDDDRPTRVEDAYPIERFAFEALLPYQVEREPRGITTHSVVPELSYGLLRNAQLGVKLPLAVEDAPGATRTGLAGLRVFALYNFTTETRSLPALSLRVDGAFPVGSLAGDRTRVALKAIATHSWGKNRIHLNGAYAIGPDRASPVAEALPRWWAGAAIDRTLFRQSTLIVGEVYALRAERNARTEINTSLGFRYQWTPTTVFDLGVSRRLKSGVGPDVAVTAGLSHAFAIPGLMPGRSSR
ncbi:MAG: hypothetical protein ACREMO_13820 [Gemmatimonadales bacterium]